MRRRVALCVFLAFALPSIVSASCNPNGYTVIYVNGIYTTEEEARADLAQIQKDFGSNLNSQKLIIQLGYNPSHLGGGGDLLESVTQAFGKPVSDYDLDTILMQIQPEVTTRKILLLGHSQGSFYTDEMYGYLTSHGVPKESIAVYNIATPESFVAGGGGYLTSDNDKVINAVRNAEVSGNLQVYLNSYYVHTSNVVNSALRANITIPKEADWASDKYGGHLPEVYLDGAGARIVADIDGELGTLKADGNTDSSDGCFTAPDPTLAYKVQKTLLAVSDPLTDGISSANNALGNDALTLAHGAFGVLASGFGALTHTLGFGTTAGQVAAAAFPVDAQLQHEPAPSSATPPPHDTTADVPPPAPQPAPVQNDAPPPAPEPVVPASGVTPPSPQGSIPQVSISPGFGGGGGATVSVSVQGGSSASQQTQSTQPVSLSVTSPSDGSSFATTSVTLTGTTDGGAVVTATFGASTASSTADSSGTWSFPLTIPEGSVQVGISATDGAGRSSATVNRAIIVDLTPPAATTASVAACSATLLAGSCLVATTTVDVAWGSAAGASYYALARNGVPGATTTALSSQASLTAGATTTLEVVSYDAAGNAAASTPVDVAAISQPLLINEIGWGGTGTDPTNQWIEIKNNSGYTLDLSHVTLSRSGGASLQLSGTLPATTNQNFLVIAPGDPTFFGAHVLTVSFPALATTTGEQLSLVWNASTTLDATPAVGACPLWCAGAYRATLGSNVSGLPNLTSPLSMERKASTDGTLASSWQNSDSYAPWLPGGSGSLWGTSGADNSAGLPDAGVYCGSKTNLLVPEALPGPSFTPSSDCVFLSKFVSGNTSGATRFGGVFRGDVASSTGGASSLGKGLASDVPMGIQSLNPPTGDHFFFAIWENRSFGNDSSDFNNYFTTGTPPAPHGNYVTIPFTYAP